jgi:hypothetical protein
MEARLAATRSRPLLATSRRWRGVLAGLISLALVLSFFHGWTFDGDDAAPAISIAQAAGDLSGNAPAHPAPVHGDHCLTHVSSVATQETAVAIEYIAHGYRWVSMRSPEAADLLSPFEPPRA